MSSGKSCFGEKSSSENCLSATCGGTASNPTTKNFSPSISGGGGSDKSRNRFSVFGNEREEEKNSEDPKIEAQI